VDVVVAIGAIVLFAAVIVFLAGPLRRPHGRARRPTPSARAEARREAKCRRYATPSSTSAPAIARDHAAIDAALRSGRRYPTA
jgi:hypothetical protein